MSDSPASALLQQMSAARRCESRAAARRLVAIADLVELRVAEDAGASDDWALDVIDAVGIEVSAELSISRDLASSHLRYAHALRTQLPKLGKAFINGDIDEATFRAAVFRTGLIIDDDVLADIDTQLADKLPRWGTCSRGQLNHRIDKIIGQVDLDAVRRRRDRVDGRDVFVGTTDNGLADIHATVFATDAFAFADRLTALANTVCADDPRTMAQRRADAVGALAAGSERLSCRCTLRDCPAGGTTATAVVIHVVTDRETVEGTAQNPGTVADYDGLIPPEMIAALADSASIRPLVHPGAAAPENGYVPSKALADFVRARDVTCRFPGCDVPARKCDIDHTIPCGQGGPTAASNLKCLCRGNHLAKTFWGWHDEQLRDGTVIWTSAAGQRYVTHPGSALIFPGLCTPTAPVTVTPVPERRCVDKTAMMPRRRRPRAKQRAAEIAAERRANYEHRTNPTQPYKADEDFTYDETLTTAQDPDPPPY